MSELSSLFSGYVQPENRVTSPLIAVLRRLPPDLASELLGKAVGDQSLPFVSFKNQPASAPGSVPDAKISANFTYLFETKIEPNALRKDQLHDHLANLEESPTGGQKLLILTPDSVRPHLVDDLNDARAVWFNFAQLSAAIDEILQQSPFSIDERSRYLMTEFQALMRDMGLLAPADDVVIVAARLAYPIYQECSAYACQPGRSFRRGLQDMRMGFYADREIKPELPRVIHREDGVAMARKEVERRLASADPADQRMATVIRYLLDAKMWGEGDTALVFFLTGQQDAETYRMPKPVVHSGPSAWTMGQRYTSLKALTEPHPALTTSDLDRRFT